MDEARLKAGIVDIPAPTCVKCKEPITDWFEWCQPTTRHVACCPAKHHYIDPPPTFARGIQRQTVDDRGAHHRIPGR